MSLDTPVGDLHLRQSDPLPLGHMVLNHKHHFGHTTFCMAGGFRIKTGSDVVTIRSPRPDYHGPTFHWVPAHTEHEFESIEQDSVFACIWPKDVDSGAYR